ncbi:MAG: 23S rRNA pseudouridine2605 synthase [Marivirga sp.]|jgi:23S rRNA pseudouridine2605 synthase
MHKKPSKKNFKKKSTSYPKKTGAKLIPAYDVEKIKAVEKKVDGEKSGLAEGIRLNKYIANSGVCSRREADKLIADGKVKVNKKIVTEMGYKVQAADTVFFEGKTIQREKLVYVLLNKPKGFITTMDDPKDRKTVMELVKKACEERIYPVGRLDRNTTGLLLFTNDGELAKKLTHPSHKVRKIYQVQLDKPLTEKDFLALENGLELEDGKAVVEKIAIVTPDALKIGLEITIGRNRIVRRLFEHLGYEVVKLDRTVFAGLTKKDLPRGKWKYLSEKEVIRLKHF